MTGMLEVEIYHEQRLLHGACFLPGFVRQLKWLLLAGLDPDLAERKSGVTGLFIAGQEGRVDIVVALLEAGAVVNLAPGPEGATPLFIAAQRGHRDVVGTLLAAGAMVDLVRRPHPLLPLDIYFFVTYFFAFIRYVSSGATRCGGHPALHCK